MYPLPMKIYWQILVQKLWNPIITTLMHYIPHEMAKIAYVTQHGNISANYAQLNPGPGTKGILKCPTANITKWMKALLAKTAVTE